MVPITVMWGGYPTFRCSCDNIFPAAQNCILSFCLANISLYLYTVIEFFLTAIHACLIPIFRRQTFSVGDIKEDKVLILPPAPMPLTMDEIRSKAKIVVSTHIWTQFLNNNKIIIIMKHQVFYQILWICFLNFRKLNV